jgi:hypothetical protein
MSQRVAKPADIKTLKNWVDRWPKAGNLLFDEATREPTINASDGTKVGSIPWKREGDIITVLTQPTKFTQNIVELAKKRITSINVEAFNGCKALVSVIIPSSVKSIGRSAFSSCSALIILLFQVVLHSLVLLLLVSLLLLQQLNYYHKGPRLSVVAEA